MPIVHYTIERMENPRLIHGILFEYQKSIIQIFNISYPKVRTTCNIGILNHFISNIILKVFSE